MSEEKTSPAYASGMRGREKATAGKLRRVEIEIAKNGVTVSCDFYPRKDKDQPLFEPKIPDVFTNRQLLHSFIDEELDRADVLKGKPGDAKEEKAEGEKA